MAIANFGFTFQGAWEAIVVSFQLNLLHSGPISLVYGSIFGGIGSAAAAISLTEIAFMYEAVIPEFWVQFQGMDLQSCMINFFVET